MMTECEQELLADLDKSMESDFAAIQQSKKEGRFAGTTKRGLKIQKPKGYKKPKPVANNALDTYMKMGKSAAPEHKPSGAGGQSGKKFMNLQARANRFTPFGPKGGSKAPSSKPSQMTKSEQECLDRLIKAEQAKKPGLLTRVARTAAHMISPAGQKPIIQSAKEGWKQSAQPKQKTYSGTRADFNRSVAGANIRAVEEDRAGFGHKPYSSAKPKPGKIQTVLPKKAVKKAGAIAPPTPKENKQNLQEEVADKIKRRKGQVAKSYWANSMYENANTNEQLMKSDIIG